MKMFILSTLLLTFGAQAGVEKKMQKKLADSNNKLKTKTSDCSDVSMSKKQAIKIKMLVNELKKDTQATVKELKLLAKSKNELMQSRNATQQEANAINSDILVLKHKLSKAKLHTELRIQFDVFTDTQRVKLAKCRVTKKKKIIKKSVKRTKKNK